MDNIFFAKTIINDRMREIEKKHQINQVNMNHKKYKKLFSEKLNEFACQMGLIASC